MANRYLLGRVSNSKCHPVANLYKFVVEYTYHGERGNGVSFVAYLVLSGDALEHDRLATPASVTFDSKRYAGTARFELGQQLALLRPDRAPSPGSESSGWSAVIR